MAKVDFSTHYLLRVVCQKKSDSFFATLSKAKINGNDGGQRAESPII